VQEVSPSTCGKHICTYGIADEFPNISIALMTYMTLPVANTEGVSLFLVLKRAKD